MAKPTNDEVAWAIARVYEKQGYLIAGFKNGTAMSCGELGGITLPVLIFPKRKSSYKAWVAQWALIRERLPDKTNAPQNPPEQDVSEYEFWQMKVG